MTETRPANFRTSVINIDRPGDPTVFGDDVRAAAAEIIARYPAGQARSALLPMLHLVQSEQGHVTPDGIAFCAEHARPDQGAGGRVSPRSTRCTSAAPTGEFLVSVCTNTLCGMLGGDEIFAALSEALGIGMNETTADGTITLEHAECLAACDYAPVVTVNYEFFDNQTVGSAMALVRRLRAGERPMPTRGAPLCTFREIERQIAGFFDARAEALECERHRSTRPRRACGSPRAGRVRAVLRESRRGHDADTARYRGARSADKRPRCAADHGRVGLREPRTARWTEGGLTCRLLPCSPSGSAPTSRGRSPTTSALDGYAGAADCPHAGPRFAHRNCAQGLQPARPRRRRLPDRHEVAVHPAGQARRAGKPHYVVVNADEGEPGTCRDLPLMMNDPHSMIEGIIIACYAVRADHAFIYIRGEAVHAIRRVLAAVERGVRTRVRRRATSSAPASPARSPCTAAPAPTSAARRRRCSTRSRASAASRGSSRRSRRPTASTTRRPSSTTSARWPACRTSCWAAPTGSSRWVRRARPARASTRCPDASPSRVSTRRRWARRCAS